ncbi:MAG: hypothetical protein FJ260_09105 [Planctomycetes bacterium]|nr:hypothetical protein [Planctomycetota bacterium]
MSEGSPEPRAQPGPLGGIVHTYLGYDPAEFPPPTRPPTGEAADAMMEHMLAYGTRRRFTDRELAEAIRLDPSQIRGLGPSLDALKAMLEERKRRILERHSVDRVQQDAAGAYEDAARRVEVPPALADRIPPALSAGQLAQLERLYRRVPDGSEASRSLMRAIARLRDRFAVEQLASGYAFTGREELDVPGALAVKEELARIDRLLEQIEEALRNAKPAIIDMDALREFASEEQVADLDRLQRQVNEMLRRMAEEAGLERSPEGYRASPKALRTYQRHLLSSIFADLADARRGRHEGVHSRDGSVELPSVRPYEFGDSPAALDVPQSILNAVARTGRARPGGEDLVVHRTRRTPRCATALVLDMSGSMRYGGQYVACKRMALALDGLIRSEYPGDFLQAIEMYTLARLRPSGEIIEMMPKPVSINDPVVRLRANMSDPQVTEFDLPLHFTNIQRALSLARQVLSAQDTPNRQVFLLTDGLPTAHFEGSDLLMLYPPDPRTERETMREAMRCKAEGIVINVFLLPSWSQTEEDVRFAHRMAEATGGRVLFVGGEELDRFVVWDYVRMRRTVIG